ncbi:MAG: hypothetical protein E7260_01425 [Lachnospiraceae bacterium]|nr:hypothetical protein [Lachnospiraceae bacterium]
MKRNAINVLQKWKEQPERKPFYLTGIKGVGKTYLAYDFANDFFDSCFYLNFDHNRHLVEKFETVTEADVITVLAEYFTVPEELLYATPFIFDEIYLCPNFIKTLWNVIKDRNHLYWIFISSYDTLAEEIKETMFSYVLFPLQFDEFLVAIGKEWYVEVIRAHYTGKKKIPDIVHQELLSTFDEYLWIGGMPDVINEYLTMEATINIPERQYLQKQISTLDLHHIIEESLEYKCRQVLSTVEEQLKKSNQKFQFNLIRKGITYQMYKDALKLLTKHQILYRVNHLEKEQQFKLFYPDFSFCSSERNDELTAVEHHVRLQNYVVQTLTEKKTEVLFWESKSQASVEFIIREKELYFPLELKLEGKSKSKSIQSFAGQYPVGNSIRISSSNFVENDENFILPVYSLFCFKNDD